ncbi:hypothetical protein P171DRAFT_431450 [Karstenula rhodostoma CBS 690.94]|uniref:Uncharacterized protein n=1 Tax=Karstenula rhodostoma CBS 690.94 TaxID=1392251 RepID=A0A9P4UCZ4_9PLEO|nr:hypothetical protein P171DRAFT_431450 [Karstenula rhodostoma CBS 690.94]
MQEGELKCGECEIRAGPSTESIYKTSPPTNTLAIIVNISNAGGSLKVYKTADNQWGNVFVDKVGTEDCEDGNKIVIASWEADWWYRSLGETGIKYIVKKGIDAKST